MAIDLERGLPIVRRTLCRVGSHTWIHSGADSAATPPEGQRCDCGLVVWQAEATR